MSESRTSSGHAVRVGFDVMAAAVVPTVDRDVAEEARQLIAEIVDLLKCEHGYRLVKAKGQPIADVPKGGANGHDKGGASGKADWATHADLISHDLLRDHANRHRDQKRPTHRAELQEPKPRWPGSVGVVCRKQQAARIMALRRRGTHDVCYRLRCVTIIEAGSFRFTHVHDGETHS